MDFLFNFDRSRHMRMEHGPDALRRDRSRGSAETIDDLGQAAWIGLGAHRGTLHSDSAETGSDEDLSVA
jgi:hypothetical protein